MGSKYGSFSQHLLTAIGEATGFFEWPIEYTESWRRQQLFRYSKKRYYDGVQRLKKRGLVRIVKKGTKQFLELTKPGQLEMLFTKAKLTTHSHWDGKWRIIIFDIPEDVKEKRDQLRWLLKRNGFIKLQASVFISPYALNREAIKFLKETRLNNYIRVIRSDEIDDDTDLKKKFKLNIINT